jgi:hypothetical protein
MLFQRNLAVFLFGNLCCEFTFYFISFNLFIFKHRALDMDDFNGKFCGQGKFPLIKNSMSLLMENMPQFYLNLNETIARIRELGRKHNEKILNSNSDSLAKKNINLFYLLKDFMNFNTNNDLQLSNTRRFSNFQQSLRIQNDLTSLIKDKPQLFTEINIPETFNCTNKQKGLHRDPFDCTKYYFCRENNDNFIQTKAYKCTKDDAIFNMQGCFCDTSLINERQVHCKFLEETFCDFAFYRGLTNKKVKFIG